MGEWLSRKSLYDLVWSEPLKTLSPRFGISDVALRKACKRAMVPTPERGHWARKAAGKKTWVLPLPERPPAMDDEVLIGGRQEYWSLPWTNEELLGPLPPLPQFDTSLESIRERITKELGKVTVAHKVTWWHPAISRLLKKDEERRQKQQSSTYAFPWDGPRFEGALERRKLRLLNALFVAVAKFQGRSLPDEEAVKGSISFYGQHVCFKLALSKKKGGDASKNPAGVGQNLTFSILDSYHSEVEAQSWLDDENGKIEERLNEIAIQIVFLAEDKYRKGIERRYELRKEQKAELEEEVRQRKLAAERAERERIQKLEKARIDRLLGQAAAFERAAVIRKYVDAVHKAISRLSNSPAEKFEAWSRWALAEADRIDPSRGERFLESMIETG